MGLFSWLNDSTNEKEVEGLDNTIPEKTQCYYIEGFLNCSYFANAIRIGDKLTEKYPNVKVDVSAYIKQQWNERSIELQKEFNTNQTSSPFIYEGCDLENQKLIGGYTDFAKKVRTNYKISVPLD
ncbi:uncharacterized protein BX663DRAFT_497613 [Cokeromyces recurvatus]|uniref:uncharacterized protein n=1 Tax=Cokeromyces recurvatus TaxID=90255 RepID=UPI00221E7ECF|nr:uncharacterized protein BX663DRAFT_497613 [Cokeromyces recurvatus]KAI7906801.1 hypothetical protein BX663DRAFT_497613 [Cokeromyces recurvatus]